jgi:hypothetical protein
MWYVVQRTWHK